MATVTQPKKAEVPQVKSASLVQLLAIFFSMVVMGFLLMNPWIIVPMGGKVIGFVAIGFALVEVFNWSIVKKIEWQKTLDNSQMFPYVAVFLMGAAYQLKTDLSSYDMVVILWGIAVVWHIVSNQIWERGASPAELVWLGIWIGITWVLPRAGRVISPTEYALSTQFDTGILMAASLANAFYRPVMESWAERHLAKSDAKLAVPDKPKDKAEEPPAKHVPTAHRVIGPTGHVKDKKHEKSEKPSVPAGKPNLVNVEPLAKHAPTDQRAGSNGNSSSAEDNSVDALFDKVVGEDESARAGAVKEIVTTLRKLGDLENRLKNLLNNKNSWIVQAIVSGELDAPATLNALKTLAEKPDQRKVVARWYQEAKYAKPSIEEKKQEPALTKPVITGILNSREGLDRIMPLIEARCQQLKDTLGKSLDSDVVEDMVSGDPKRLATALSKLQRTHVSVIAAVLSSPVVKKEKAK